MKMLSCLNQLRKKLRRSTGETLTETLVAVLIISIVSVALATMVNTATKINQTAREYDESLDSALVNMATDTSTSVNINVTIKTKQNNEEITRANEFFNGIKIKGDTSLNLYAYTYTVSEIQPTEE